MPVSRDILLRKYILFKKRVILLAPTVNANRDTEVKTLMDTMQKTKSNWKHYNFKNKYQLAFFCKSDSRKSVLSVDNNNLQICVMWTK
jgi:hypothetical protein